MADLTGLAAARLAAIVESSDDAIISKDLNGIVTSWNASAVRIFGYTPEEMIGQSIRRIIPADRQIEEDTLVARIRSGEKVDHFETVRQHRDGTLVPISLTVWPIRDVNGEIVGASKIARDIRDRKRLAAIVESSDDAIVSKTLDGIVTSWNPASERLFGFTAEEMIGQSIRRIIPADRQSEEDHVISRLRRGEKVEHFETIRQRKDGTLVPISLTVSPIRDDRGYVVGASKIARDIRDRREAEAERTRLYNAAQQASQLKDEFLATLSHELRTPLNAILGYARMIRSGILSADKLPRAIATIERNATSLTQIVEDVLDVSRIVSGKMRLDVQPTDLAAVVRDSIDAVLPGAEAKGLSIDTVFDLTSASVSGDPQRLQQIVWNLLSNAVKFTGEGGRIEVGIRRAGWLVELTVRDTGIGIGPEFLPYVFDRFRQADAGTTRERGGLGLGLAIAQQLVELHGGTVSAASGGVGKGTTFTVRLPMRGREAARTARPAANAAEEESVAVGVSDLRGVGVLVVDDDADAIEMIRDVLEAAGATVHSARSAAEAVELLDRMEPDVIVSDLGMPGTDGFELIRKIRRHPNLNIRAVPAAALTAYARSEDRAKALRNGYQMHLSKPIDPAELTAAVAGLTRKAGSPG
jgi:PAS domain S-box-containing protein